MSEQVPDVRVVVPDVRVSTRSLGRHTLKLEHGWLLVEVRAEDDGSSTRSTLYATEDEALATIAVPNLRVVSGVTYVQDDLPVVSATTGEQISIIVQVVAPLRTDGGDGSTRGPVHLWVDHD